MQEAETVWYTRNSQLNARCLRSFDLQPLGHCYRIIPVTNACDRSFHAAIFLSYIIFPLSEMRERVNQRDYTCTENFPNQRMREKLADTMDEEKIYKIIGDTFIRIMIYASYYR